MKRPLKIGLVNINNSFLGQNYLPYSIGCLQAYAEKFLEHPEYFQFQLPLYKRIPIQKGVEHLSGTDIIFFSTYVWNIRISLEIAKRVKVKQPSTIIVFGGPQVPDRVDPFLRQYPFVDFACHGEGEQPFLRLLEHGPEGEWTKIPSLSFLDRDKKLVQTPRSPRLTHYDEIPSPYTVGTFDRLMKTYPNESWIVLWETNRGCPFACTFCDWGSAIASKVYRFGMERILAEIGWFSKHHIEFIYCCDANFGILPRDFDIVEYVVKKKKEVGYPKALSVQNTKNSTEKSYRIQKLMGEGGLNKGVTLSLQSVDPATLKLVKRANIKTRTYRELQTRFTRDRIETYTDMIIGLAGETYESFANGVSSVIENGQHNRIQFNNLSILPNAEMGDPAYQKKYGLIIRETDIINVHGNLSDTEEIMEKQQLVVGTGAMPSQDWVKTRAFSWMTALLHFDKLLQMPFILLHRLCSVSYRELIELFMKERKEFPILARIRQFFLDKALDIQQGGAEYCQSKKWLNIWWPADEWILIDLCTKGQLEQFYDECEEALSMHLKSQFIQLPKDLLHEMIQLNHQLIKLPFQNEDLEIKCAYNSWDVYQANIRDFSLPLEDKNVVYEIDRTSERWKSWEEWCQKVVWYGNKKGAYLYPCKTRTRSLTPLSFSSAQVRT